MTLTYEDILSATQGRVLATSPAHGWDRSDGSWEAVRGLSREVRNRLVIVGMAGAERTHDQQKRDDQLKGREYGRALRGQPAGPDELAWIVRETGLLPAAQSSTWDAAACVDWYVAGVLAVQNGRHALTLEDEPEPEPVILPAWVTDWLQRILHEPKRAYALAAAECIYGSRPEPPSSGQEWEEKVWSKLGRRWAAETQRKEGSHAT